VAFKGRHSALAATFGAERHISTGATLRTGLLPEVKRDSGRRLGRPVTDYPQAGSFRFVRR
jgi:hypothetical protein